MTLHMFACGWIDANRQEHVQVFELHGDARRLAAELGKDKSVAKVDVWEL